MMRAGLLIVCVALAAVGVFWSASGSRPPQLLVSATSPPPTADRCAECHSEIVARFQSAPHRNTLARPTPEIGNLFSSNTAGSAVSQIRYVEQDGELRADTDDVSLAVDWVFGSGRHARTPVSVLTGPDGRLEVIEHRVTWYPGTGLGQTLSLAESVDHRAGPEAIGNHHGPSAAQECFSCHSTHFRHEPGRPPHDVVTGVGCVRCHARAAEHLETIDDGPISLDRWFRLSPLESINRCGECHRRADHFTADELEPENETLVRFAPVGLSLSACFLRQTDVPGARLDCLTCHDPHSAASRDADVYREACLTCHSGTAPAPPDCSTASRETNCAECHMRRIPVNDQLGFTDHWIR